MAVIIWHNPRCSKSRQALALLTERGLVPVVRLYLTDVPTAVEIADVLQKLKLPAIKITRTNEAAFKATGLSKNSAEADLIAALVAEPKLIERAIVVNGNRAALGRPPEAILDIL